MPEPPRSRAELGVVLAGGAASRFPGKLDRVLPLAVAALGEVLEAVVVVAKAGTPLPAVPCPVWREPDEPRHPLLGVAWALERAGGRAVLAAAGDMPAIPAALLRALLGAGGEEPAVIPRHRGGIEPLLALYRPAAAPALRRGAEAGRPARAIAEDLEPEWLAWPDAGAFTNVNRPEDLP